MTEATELSYSELRSLVTKAARGAGLDWGLAEEAGWAAEWLARRGLPAADWAMLWLGPRSEGQACPVEAGCRLAEGPGGDSLPDGLHGPGYLLPFIARVAAARGPVALTSALGLVAAVATDGRVTFGPCWGTRTDGWTLGPAADRGPATRPVVGRMTLEALDAMALRTTVPRSDSSSRDAGAGTMDND